MNFQNENNNLNNFSCENCKYFTNNKKDYKKHLLTKKHLSYNQFNNNSEMKFYSCNCGKTYSYNSSLYNHKKKCQYNQNQLVEKKTNYDEIITTLINENNELRKTLIEQTKIISDVIPKIGNTINSNNTINNVNKFNINVFLNEQCKDAISMENFIKSLEISLSNLLFSKDKGLIEGISNIFIENMNKLPLTQRPIHCTDVKRETLYIKNETWEKDEKREKTKDAIKKVSKLQTCNINKYVDTNPDFMSISKKKDEYIDIVRVATSSIENKEDKIIKNICKNVYINENKIDIETCQIE